VRRDLHLLTGGQSPVGVGGVGIQTSPRRRAATARENRGAALRVETGRDGGGSRTARGTPAPEAPYPVYSPTGRERRRHKPERPERRPVLSRSPLSPDTRERRENIRPTILDEPRPASESFLDMKTPPTGERTAPLGRPNRTNTPHGDQQGLKLGQSLQFRRTGRPTTEALRELSMEAAASYYEVRGSFNPN